MLKINVLDWPPYSPDLKIMEKIWGYLSKDVDSEGPLKKPKKSGIKIEWFYMEIQRYQILAYG